MIAIKETIYTIPVMEALQDGGECPFCVMAQKLEANAVDFLMGPSTAYMEGDIRMDTDEKGFCARHYQSLYDSQNRLGMALILHTHLKKINSRLPAVTEDSQAGKKGLFAKKDAATPLAAFAGSMGKSCYICDMAEKTFERYVDTFFQLWKAEEEVRQLVENGKGFCIPHFAMAMDMAAQKLDGKSAAAFQQRLARLQRENLLRVEADLDWFIKKFDYRFKEEPWKDSKDAIERAVAKLSARKLQG